MIWAILVLLFGGYESFKFENSLIGSIYPTSPQKSQCGDDKGNPHSSEGEAKFALIQTVSERGKYWYNYSEYLCTSILKSCCCCLLKNSTWFQRRIDRLKRH